MTEELVPPIRVESIQFEPEGVTVTWFETRHDGPCTQWAGMAIPATLLDEALAELHAVACEVIDKALELNARPPDSIPPRRRRSGSMGPR